MNKIPFFKPSIGEEEKKAICDCIDSGWIVMGKKTQEFEEKFAEYVGAKYAVHVDSGTSALFLSLRCQEKFWDISLEGLPIQTPSFTFASDPEVIVNVGATPFFMDVNKKTFCVEDCNEYHPNKFNIVVHLTGNLAKAPATIYDSAHRIEKDDVLGSESLWCYSFYATKNMSTVQGGMIALNDEEKYKWLKKARDHGISKGTLERYTQKSVNYDIEFPGWRVKPTDITAVIGLEQLKKLPAMTARRNEIVARYNMNLGLDRVGNHLYPILVEQRGRFVEQMAEANIQCSMHFSPLHLMTAYKQYCDYSLPNTEYLGEKEISIPLFPAMTDEQIDYISDNILKTNLLIKE